MLQKLVIFCLCFGTLIRAEYASKKPHIVVITADDMGWNDVSYHGSNVILTPNIDALAYHGIILNDFHTSSLCTPSRSALMTGQYPIHIGTQHSVILEAEPSGLPLDKKILPQYLQDAGYSTHLVGKWHLGFYKEVYTPTKRGFDTFFGYWQGHQDYFTHNAHETYGPFDGYDMHNNLKTDWQTQGEYSTDLFTRKAIDLIYEHDEEKPMFLYLSQIAPHAGAENDPLQAPEEEIEKFAHIPNTDKRKFAAMMSKLDESIGRVIEALNQKNMLENSIILFMSDNGAPSAGIYSTTGSNYPFRGIKGSEWEGGTRVPAMIWSPFFARQQRVSNMMMHMVDVLPTLYAAAGMNSDELKKLDGVNMWPTLLDGNDQSPRFEYPYNIDPAEQNNAVGAVRIGDWKYFQSTSNETGARNDWYNILGLEAFFDDSDYYPYDVIESLTGQAIRSVYAEFNKNIKINQNYSENDILEKDFTAYQILTPDTILRLRSEAKIQCDYHNIHKDPACMPNEYPCLIDLKHDPCERYNVANRYSDLYTKMQKTFEKYRQQVVPPINKPRDENADPKLWNDQWVPWGDFSPRTFWRIVRKYASKVKLIVTVVVHIIFYE